MYFKTFIKFSSCFLINFFSENSLSILGVSLPSMVAPFVQQCISTTNTWPLMFYSTGPTYSVGYQNDSRWSQIDRLSLLCLTRSREEWLAASKNIQSLLSASIKPLFSKKNIETSEIWLNPRELELSEASARATVFNRRELMRLSTIGAYISKRCNLVFESHDNNSNNNSPKEFVTIGFASINLSNLCDILE
jgi:hypothetical protein